MKNRRPLIRGNVLKEDRFRLSDRTREIGIQSDIILPLIAQDQVIGSASVASLQEGAYFQSHVEFLQPLLDHIAVHVDNARLHRELEESHRHLRMIFNRASELIFLSQVADDGSVLYISVNDALVRETGLTREQILGKTPEKVISNAVDALPRDGTIHISTRLAGESVEVAVRDTGVGMSEDTRKRIFDPFFTTRHDVGSGLGLSMAYRLVASWGGHIAAESELEKGPSVTLTLPV